MTNDFDFFGQAPGFRKLIPIHAQAFGGAANADSQVMHGVDAGHFSYALHDVYQIFDQMRQSRWGLALHLI